MPRDAHQLSIKNIQERYSHPDVIVPPQLLLRLRRDSRAGARKLYDVLLRRSEEQSNENRRLEAMLHFERVLWKAGITRIAGVDEVGIGPLAGPCSCRRLWYFPRDNHRSIHDSKLLDASTRERLDNEIRLKASGIGIGIVEIEEIDRINIYHAGLRAMQLAVAALPLCLSMCLSTAGQFPISRPQNSFDKGDGINFSIAAASIIAKVYRDRLMTEMDSVYPGYGFAEHKGYATPVHQAAIRKLGPCPIHRKSFDYIRELCGLYSSTYYGLKDEGLKISSRTELLAWEKRARMAKAQMSEIENKKIQITVRRLWKRISD